MRYLNIFFIVIFLTAAFLQWNDPDPALWISIYLIGAYLCFTAWRKELNRWIFITALCFFLMLALYYFFIPNGVLTWLTAKKTDSIFTDMDSAKPWIETSREFFGLLIICLALVMNMIFYSRDPKRS